MKKEFDMLKKLSGVCLLCMVCALLPSACLLEGDIDQIRPRRKTEEPPKDPYAGYVLIPDNQLGYSPASQSIYAYTGPVPAGKVRIPETINGYPVTRIGTPDGAVGGGGGPFNDKGLTGVIIPNGVTIIGDFSLSNNQLTSVTIPASVTNIANRAFVNNQLTSVTIPAGVANIGDMAFLNNPITSITFMGNGVTTFGMNWIGSVGNLETLYNDPTDGGAGRYTRPDATSTTWTKQ